MTCKDCVHYEVCNRVEKQIVFTNSSFEEVINSLILGCRHFKNKADFVEIKHGEWVYWQPDGTNHLWTCSVCDGAISTPMPFVAKHIAYCERCGAKMDGERRCEE